MMKKLTERSLVKTVKGVAGSKKNRLMYMLWELEPSVSRLPHLTTTPLG